MSIPITCAGCKSAFDVPDNLAGKTIRCTSCKAQMTVPDEVVAVDVVEAVEDEAPVSTGKKPFGSGVAPAAAPAATAPKPAPKPVPAPAAKAAAKPVAKVAKDEDEEGDEDDKNAKPKAKTGTKPAAGPKKSGIVGSTKKRRDDDDEDDDDDDTPRKKKKAQGGSGPMIAIIAGATIGLALIAGVGIYFLAGSKDTDTAASTGGTSTTPTANPTPTTPTTPTTGGTGGGRPTEPVRPTPAPNIPSAPTTGDPVLVPANPGTGGPVPGAPAAGGPEGANAFGVNIAGLTQFGTVGTWAAFTGNGYTADFPGTPVTTTLTVAGKPVTFTGINAGKEQTFLAGFEQLPPEAAAGVKGDPKVALAAFVTAASQVPPFQGRQATDTLVDGNPAKELEFSGATLVGSIKFVLVKDRVYIFGAAKSFKNSTTATADVNRFFSSVKLTYKGDLVAGGPMEGPGGAGTTPSTPQPPMGTPGTPQPPFGQPGGNPTAGTGDGNRKAKIESFHAAAFDTENKEIYTIDARAIPGDTRIKKGVLRRYAADFKAISRYHLPQMASRAVIDSKAGLLYAATVTNAGTANIHLLDNGSASGDIAVYDLKQIRDGKTADGKELKESTELKPVATINFKHMIHAIELSDDGKSLYVLTTAGTAKKLSSLTIVDTETRKTSDSKPLPRPVRDMAKAGDGKSLIIIEDFVGGGKGGGGGASVGTFDFATMSLINVTQFQGAVVDVAPIKAGGAVVTVLPVTPQPPIVPPPGNFPMPGGTPMPGGGPTTPGGGGGGGQPAHKFKFQLYLLNDKGSTEMDLGAAQRFANGGYAEFDPENKKLFVSSYRETGLDVFDVTDTGTANGLKLSTTIHTAGREQLGGHCVVTPDGKALVFHTGLVIDTNNVGGGGALGAPPGGVGGTPGVGTAPIPPGGVQPVNPGTGTPPGGTPTPVPAPVGGTTPLGGKGTAPGGTTAPPGRIPSMPMPPGAGGGMPPPQ